MSEVFAIFDQGELRKKAREANAEKNAEKPDIGDALRRNTNNNAAPVTSGSNMHDSRIMPLREEGKLTQTTTAAETTPQANLSRAAVYLARLHHNRSRAVVSSATYKSRQQEVVFLDQAQPHHSHSKAVDFLGALRMHHNRNQAEDSLVLLRNHNHNKAVVFSALQRNHNHIKEEGCSGQRPLRNLNNLVDYLAI